MDGVFAYRKGGGKWKALAEYSRLHPHYPWAAKGDFTGCFPNFPITAMEVLVREQHWMTKDLHEALISSLKPTVEILPQYMRRPGEAT